VTTVGIKQEKKRKEKRRKNKREKKTI